MSVSFGTLTSQNALMGVAVLAWQDAAGNEIYDKIVQPQTGAQTGAYDLTDVGTVEFFVRDMNYPSTVIVNGGTAAVVGQASQGLVSYAWSSGDLANEGTYRAWWRLYADANPTSSSTYSDTAEFDLWIAAHSTGQGQGVQTGIIARRCGAMMPSSWGKLRQLPIVGDWELQNKIEAVKKRFLMPSVYQSAETEYLLDPVAIDWIAKQVVLETIPAAIDYWLDQRMSATTPQEHAAYGSRVQALQQLSTLLSTQVQGMFDEFQSIVGAYTRNKYGVPLSDMEGVPMITPDPVGMPSSYGIFLPRVLTPDYYLFPYEYPFPDTPAISIGGVLP